MGMTEKSHAVRLLRDFSHFPPAGITINWRAGQVIEDTAVISLLTRINAPVEPVDPPADQSLVP
jgi:hypothetical protein